MNVKTFHVDRVLDEAGIVEVVERFELPLERPRHDDVALRRPEGRKMNAARDTPESWKLS